MDQQIYDKLNEVSSGADIAGFLENYRQAFDEQREADMKNLENQRRLGQTSIMSANNMRGTLHSSFPGIQKLQYDTNTYEPAVIKTQSSYQSGLDKLYSSVANYYNQIKAYQKAISDYSKKTS